MKKTDSIFGWHFVGDTLRDGSKIPRNGVWLPTITPIKICQRGYHGSLHPFDALQYAPGDTLCYCEFRGKIIYESNKFVAEQRRIITRMVATEMLRYFARMEAVKVVHLWEPQGIVLDWLMTGDAAAYAAARAAAYAAARAASYAAARAASYAAARAAADAAAYAADAAADASYAAARAAAYAATYDPSSAAARAASYAATYDPSAAAARRDFGALVFECFGMEEQNNEHD